MSSPRDGASGYEAGAAQPAPGAPAPNTQGAQSPTSPGAHRDTATRERAAYGESGMRAGYDDGRSATQTGFTVLAAVLLMLSGLWSFLEGITAILRNSFFAVTQNYIYHFNVDSWGWIHLGLGIVVFAAGACVLLGQTWARAVGIVLAVFSGIANFMFLPYYPVWSIILIAVDVFIIWALATGPSRRASV
jgi:hypothetical protein